MEKQINNNQENPAWMQVLMYVQGNHAPLSQEKHGDNKLNHILQHKQSHVTPVQYINYIIGNSKSESEACGSGDFFWEIFA